MVSVVGEVREVRDTIVTVPSWCNPTISSDLKDPQIAWVLAKESRDTLYPDPLLQSDVDRTVNHLTL